MTDASDHEKTSPNPTEPSAAVEALRSHQRQLDADGVEVGVSRQALDEVLAMPWNEVSHNAAMGRWVLQAHEIYGLHPRTAKLVRTFAFALAGKLREAEKKYGYSDGWADTDWEAECQSHLTAHVLKGDPLDVAAYAAFCWQRGWSTTPEAAGPRSRDVPQDDQIPTPKPVPILAREGQEGDQRSSGVPAEVAASTGVKSDNQEGH